MSEAIGFIGLGIMGAPMALNLRKAGIPLLVADLNERAVERLVKAGATAATAAEIGSRCDIVFTILPDGAVVRSVLLGDGGVAASLRAGGLVCDMSSVSPMEARACASALAEKGIGFVDAPVSGGEPKAIDGTLAFMVGGEAAHFARLKKYFDAMGASAMLVGDIGSGCTAKLANQMIVNLTITAVAEALVFAVKAGTDPEKVYQAIRGGLAGSVVLDAKAPMMIARDFKPGGKLSINHKDIKNVLATAHQIDAPIPFSASLFEVMQSLKVGNHMDDDHAGIVQYFEELAGVRVGKR
jgi:2-hydroxy-3-oxopropionate reductase